MIKNFSINKLGRFNNFNFNGVENFKRFNVLYGWNYSGKTTLSRAFALFDTKKIPPHYDNGFDFTLELEDGTKLKSSNTSDFTKIQTKVFNSDYVENNLFFKDTGASNILVLADNAQETMTRIENLEKEIKHLKNNILEFQKQEKENKNFIDETKTREAAKIKTNLHTTFIATTFSSYVKIIEQNGSCENFIIDDDNELCKKRATAISEKNKDSIDNIPFITVINIENLKSILNKTVSIATPLKRLSENKDAEKWVRDGLQIHKNSNTCFYCGKALDENIINELNAHFDKTYTEFISNIETLKNEIKEIDSFPNLPDTSKFYEQFENKYLKDKAILEEKRKHYNSIIKKIHQLLEIKQKSVTKPIIYDIDYDFEDINNYIKTINNGVIAEHNAFNLNFDNQKEQALEDLKKHYVAVIIAGTDYKKAIQALNEAEIGIKKTTEEIEIKEKEKSELEAKISESVAGADKVNKILDRLFMGKSEIKLFSKSSVETDKYILKRNNEQAHNLSEGEKTAISFAHFLASLDSKELTNQYGNIILYIDDPISSLDNNHIYAIYSEIDRLKNEKCDRIVGNDNKKYKQLFISTHNYNLFNLLTERNEQHIGIYYVQRNNQDSVITNFPKNILKQKAEYSFLFSQIKKYIDNNSQESDYVIGHFLRRLLEIFATYKNPTKNDLRKKIEQIVDLKPEYKENETLILSIYKTVNEESHTYITNEIVNNGSLKNTAESVLNFIKMVDPDQYSFLEQNYYE